MVTISRYYTITLYHDIVILQYEDKRLISFDTTDFYKKNITIL